MFKPENAWTLGIDPAMKSAGWALFTPDGIMRKSGVCAITAIASILEREKNIFGIEDVLLSIEDFPRVSARVAGGHVARATAVTTAAARQIETTVKEIWPHHCRVLRVKVNTWRKAVFGTAKVDNPKHAALSLCHLDGRKKITDHNEAEAILIGEYGYSMLKIMRAAVK